MLLWTLGSIFFWMWFCFLQIFRLLGYHGSSIFSLLRNLHTLFHNVSTNLHFYQHCRGSYFSTSIPALVIYRYSDSHSDRCKMISHLVLICISLITRVEHLFMCLLVMHISLFGKLSGSAHFLIRLSAFIFNVELHELFIC